MYSCYYEYVDAVSFYSDRMHSSLFLLGVTILRSTERETLSLFFLFFSNYVFFSIFLILLSRPRNIICTSTSTYDTYNFRSYSYLENQVYTYSYICVMYVYTFTIERLDYRNRMYRYFTVVSCTVRPGTLREKFSILLV